MSLQEGVDRVMHIYKFTSQIEQVSALANQLFYNISELLQHQQKIVIAFSGGKSPVALLKQLSNMDLPWQNIIVTLADERIIETTSSDSNEHLIRTHLLQNYAKQAKFIGLVEMDKPIDEMVNFANRHMPMIDIVILGMGEDGHTASIFPDCDELAIALSLDNPARYINTNPKSAQYSRISLTLSALRNIPHIYLSINGNLKLSVFDRSVIALDNHYPISYLLASRLDIITYWHT